MRKQLTFSLFFFLNIDILCVQSEESNANTELTHKIPPPYRGWGKQLVQHNLLSHYSYGFSSIQSVQPAVPVVHHGTHRAAHHEHGTFKSNEKLKKKMHQWVLIYKLKFWGIIWISHIKIKVNYFKISKVYQHDVHVIQTGTMSDWVLFVFMIIKCVLYLNTGASQMFFYELFYILYNILIFWDAPLKSVSDLKTYQSRLIMTRGQSKLC